MSNRQWSTRMSFIRIPVYDLVLGGSKEATQL